MKLFILGKEVVQYSKELDSVSIARGVKLNKQINIIKKKNIIAMEEL